MITSGGNKNMSNLPNCPKCNSEYTYEGSGAKTSR
ncbi:hypothetical protein [Bacillus sp. FSL H8-0545]